MFLITNSEFYIGQEKCLIVDKEVPFQLLWLYLQMGKGKNIVNAQYCEYLGI